MLHRLLYTSRATNDIGMREVFDIIRTSHNRNSQAGLTGGLLFLDGYFYQLLEGLPTAVAERYKRIIVDPRHTDLVLRIEESGVDPLFESDWMALCDGSQLDPQILADHHYQPGMPADAFTGEQVYAFLMACLDRELAALAR